MQANKKKIALFLPSLHGGGAERVMVNLARGFAKRNFVVHLVLAKAEGPYLAEISPEVRLVDLGAKRVLFALPGLVRYLRRERPKSLLSAMNYANVVTIWACRLSCVPLRLVVTEHTTLSVATVNARNLRAKMMPLLIKAFYPWADAVVAVCRGVADDLVRLTGLSEKKVRVIYNPVVTPELFAKSEEPLNHPWFRSGEPPVILGVGRLTKEKDFPTLIRAFALVRKKHPVRLMILGEGEDRSTLEALVQELDLIDDVSLPGFVDNPYKYIKRAAVFVLSSRWEGLPTVLIEALALGTPVVSTNCESGPAEILEEGKWGRLVPVGNIEALAEAILKTLSEPDNRAPIQKRAQDFHLDKIVREYLSVLGLEEE